jgi:hypothetical protein
MFLKILFVIFVTCITASMLCLIGYIVQENDSMQWKSQKCQNNGGVYIKTYHRYQCLKIEVIDGQ